MQQAHTTPPAVLPLKIRQLRGILCPFLLLCCVPAWPSPNAGGFNVTEIAEGVFVHAGVHVPVDAPGHEDIANVGFIIGERCVAVVDTGGSVAIGWKLLDAIRSKTTLPVCYVINSHVHYDHLLGNAAFRDTGAKFAGHANLADAVTGSRDFFLKQFAADLGDAPDATSVVGPTIGVDGRMQLDLGNRVIELQAHPPAHTATDLSVYDVRTRTLFAGDLLFMERLPILDGSLRGWLKVLPELEAIPAGRVVPGHGPASAPWPEAVADQRRYLERLLTDVKDAIAAGQFIEDALDSVGWDEQDKWLLFEETHRRNVTRAFTELEWE